MALKKERNKGKNGMKTGRKERSMGGRRIKDNGRTLQHDLSVLEAAIVAEKKNC